MTRFQFSLAEIFWLTIVVALICSAVASFRRSLNPSEYLPVVFFLGWPTFAAPAIWRCPKKGWLRGLRMYDAIGIAVTTVMWFLEARRGGFRGIQDILAAILVVAIAFILAWIPQFFIIFAVLKFVRKQHDVRNELH